MKLFRREYKNVLVWVRILGGDIHTIVVLPNDAVFEPLFFDGGGFTERFLTHVAKDIGDLFSLTQTERKELIETLTRGGKNESGDSGTLGSGNNNSG